MNDLAKREWKLMPKEPTAEMLAAARMDEGDGSIEATYRALFDAAPEQDAKALVRVKPLENVSDKHWHVDPKAPEAFYEDVNILRWDGVCVAVALHNGGISPEEATAHAHLIAAAPDLLSALRNFYLHLLATDEDGLVEHADQMMAARAAILKAEGDNTVPQLMAGIEEDRA